MDLDRKFSKMYGPVADMSETARSFQKSNILSDKVDRKILNIIKKVQTRFDYDLHKAKNEELILRMRKKAQLCDKLEQKPMPLPITE